MLDGWNWLHMPHKFFNLVEQNYSQLEKKGLPCNYGIKQLYSYLFAHIYMLTTYHKPLLGLLSKQKLTYHMCARIHRWSLYLSIGLSTHWKFKTQLLMRMSVWLPEVPIVAQTPSELVLLADNLANSPVTSHRNCDWICSWHPFFSLCNKGGWAHVQSRISLSHFQQEERTLNVWSIFTMANYRVIVPTLCWEAVLTELHKRHPGCTWMKSLARMYVWWLGITKDVENTITDRYVNNTSWPHQLLYYILGLIYILTVCCPVQVREMILIPIDTHSKWIEAVCTPSATSGAVIEELRTLFAQFGIAETTICKNKLVI